MPADAQATLGVRASAGMVLTSKSRNISSPSSEEYGHQQTDNICKYISNEEYYDFD